MENHQAYFVENDLSVHNLVFHPLATAKVNRHEQVQKLNWHQLEFIRLVYDYAHEQYPPQNENEVHGLRVEVVSFDTLVEPAVNTMWVEMELFFILDHYPNQNAWNHYQQ
jgi:hypothetical protein